VKNYYKILGVTPKATSEDVKKAWHQLARKYHPDLHPGNPEAEEQFKLVLEAYEVLEDEGSRRMYDLTGNLTKPVSSYEIDNYFIAEIDKLNVRVCDEVAITFTYSGAGRIFRKPPLDAFFLSGPPYVSIRKKYHDNYTYRETALTYIVAPVKEGDFEIKPATIKINNVLFTSKAINLHVVANDCYFLKNHVADGPPLKFPMNFEYNASNSKNKLRGHNPGHIILIPRSKTAFFFHSIGGAMKWTFTAAGIFYIPVYIDVYAIVGAVLGSLLGGINCYLMYKMAGIKSKYFYADKYPLVRDYIDKGFQCGSSTGTTVIGSNILYKFTRLIT
jgi:DnaJ domain/BatD DUF11 like domain